jgi:2,4-dienoyl-CoA reductase-like NADH-dependent reductase (Old Yellow Enzyme family)
MGHIDLFKPYKIRNLKLKNRFVRSATWDGTADEKGATTERSISIYKALAKGNIGLIISGHMYVDLLGKAGYGQYGIDRDENIPGFRQLTDTVHGCGGKISAQISHAGLNRYPRDAARFVMSSVPDPDRPQLEMKDEDIRKIIDHFATAAARAVESGFDCIQIHGAHGFLISQSLSPLFNHRTDTWGGSFTRRLTLLIGVIEAIRKMVGPDFPLHIKLGVFDDKEGGLNINDGVAISQKIAGTGIDCIEVSVGYGGAARRFPEAEIAYFRDAAAAVKKAVPVPVIAMGGIRTLTTSIDIVNSGDADLISMCRPFVREPGILLRWHKENQNASSCKSCNRCMAETAKTGLACYSNTESVT